MQAAINKYLQLLQAPPPSPSRQSRICFSGKSPSVSNPIDIGTQRMRQHSDNISTAGTSNSFHLTPLPKVQTWTHEIPLSLWPPPCEGKPWLWSSMPHHAPFIGRPHSACGRGMDHGRHRSGQMGHTSRVWRPNGSYRSFRPLLLHHPHGGRLIADYDANEGDLITICILRRLLFPASPAPRQQVVEGDNSEPYHVDIICSMLKY